MARILIYSQFKVKDLKESKSENHTERRKVRAREGGNVGAFSLPASVFDKFTVTREIRARRERVETDCGGRGESFAVIVDGRTERITVQGRAKEYYRPVLPGNLDSPCTTNQPISESLSSIHQTWRHFFCSTLYKDKQTGNFVKESRPRKDAPRFVYQKPK